MTIIIGALIGGLIGGLFGYAVMRWAQFLQKKGYVSGVPTEEEYKQALARLLGR